MDQAIREYLAKVARELSQAAHGQSGPVIEQASLFLGWSKDKIYRELKRQVGWTSGRKCRADKGSTQISEEALRFIAGVEKASLRKNGKQTLHTPLASALAQQNGVEVNVSTGRINRLLKDRKMNIAAQRVANPVTAMRSLHPNHVHQVDPSLCLVYYMPNGEQRVIQDDELYKNKLEKIATLQFKCWRYVLYDHASGVIIPWYVAAHGETQANLFEFLMFAWGQQPGRPFHGPCKLLVWDLGSANTSSAIKNLLEALDVEHIAHRKGNARAKGGVENANNIVETHFESLLRFEPAHSVEEMNLRAAQWCNAYNANLIPNYDSSLRRPSMPPVARYDLWLRITADQLRILPPKEVCQAMLQGAEVTRKVSSKLQISYRHPQADSSQQYDLRELDGVCVGDTVTIRPVLFGNAQIAVTVPRFDGEALTHRVEPITDYDQFGFRTSAPVWGEEFDSPADTRIEKAAKALDALAYPEASQQQIEKLKAKNATPFMREGKTLTAVSHLEDVALPDYLPKRGQQIAADERYEAPKMSVVEAAKRLKARLGDEWSAEHFQWLSQRFSDGVKEEELAGIEAQLTKPVAALRVIRGGA